MNSLLLGILADALDPRVAWATVVLLIVIGLGFAVTNVAASIVLGPGRTGPGKETTYESGMVPIGDTRQRFNVRFYIVAMIFLVFDVDIIFMYPWATIFAERARSVGTVGATTNFGATLLVEMFLFIFFLLLAYLYAWGKGVFRWD